jgi:hypothetical protein
MVTRPARVLGLAVCASLGAAIASPPSAADVPTPAERAIAERFAADTRAQGVATALYRDLGHEVVAGRAEVMDGGFRGKIRLVPELPIGRYRTQLVWVAAALRAIDAFFAGFETAPSYRWRDLTLRFVRSVGKRTPSAYAVGWSVTHNVVGSLLTSERGVRETYFHELFHLNDFDHGGWSAKTLAKDYDAIVKKCGTKTSCLTPYAPNHTKVRATGTYYAFQPDNGDPVHEYAAELAVRYYREQTEMQTNGKLSRRPFKCGPAENARAWQAMVDEFFAGRDLVPACP